MKKEIFYLDESAANPGRYLIRVDHDKFFLKSTKGSYNIIAARLMGLTYGSYLRMCRDCFGAEIVGKNSYYPIPYFKKNDHVKKLVDLLNVRANVIVWEKEHPDYKEHEEYVKEKNPYFYEEVTNGKSSV